MQAVLLIQYIRQAPRYEELLYVGALILRRRPLACKSYIKAISIICKQKNGVIKNFWTCFLG